jgi:hypothetical protein
MRNPFLATAPLLFWALAACASSTGSVAAAPTPAASRGVGVEELRRDLYVFAADSFGGRETGTPYADKAASWLAARLTQLRVEPGGDSGYFHRVPMRKTVLTPGVATVGTVVAPRQLLVGRDIAFLTSLGRGAPLPKDSVDAELVFAQYGLVDTTLKRDDYTDLAVSGKVIVIVGTVPPNVTDAQRKMLENPQVLFNRIGIAIARQPAGIVLLLPDSLFRMAASQFTGTQIELATGPAPAQQPRILPFIAVAPLGGSTMVPAEWPRDAAARLPSGMRLRASFDEQTSTFNGYNVVGIVRGTDPVLRSTYVAYGAHYDHVGMGVNINGDSINNGADDDGSGSVTLLAIARAWQQAPPKRSGLFIWHIGEEKGLFGSEAFTSAPTVPLDSIVAQINADMIGRNGTDSLYIVGPGAAPNSQSSVLAPSWTR